MEHDYNCHRFDKKVKTLEDWEREHSSHGEPTFEGFHGRYQWRVCPCGAKLLEDRPTHHCHFPGCKTPTPRQWLYCKPHWFMVPAAIRRRVWAAYNVLPHGPEGNCLQVSDEWLVATQEAEEAIKQKLA